MNRYKYISQVFKKPPRIIKKRSKTQIETSAYHRVLRHPYKDSIDTFIGDDFTNKEIVDDIRAKYRDARFHLPISVIRAYRNYIIKAYKKALTKQPLDRPLSTAETWRDLDQYGE